MVNQQLLDYIISVREKGYSDDAIKAHLSKFNYSKEIIDEAFASLAPPQGSNPTVKTKKKIPTKVLIALTILLVIAALYLAWDYFSTDALCRGAKTEIYKVNDNPVICTYPDNSKIQMILLNSGSTRLNGFEIIVTGSRSTLAERIKDLDLAENDVFTPLISYDHSMYGDISKISVIPIVEGQGNIGYCSSKKITISQVDSC